MLFIQAFKHWLIRYKMEKSKESKSAHAEKEQRRQINPSCVPDIASRECAHNENDSWTSICRLPSRGFRDGGKTPSQDEKTRVPEANSILEDWVTSFAQLAMGMGMS